MSGPLQRSSAAVGLASITIQIISSIFLFKYPLGKALKPAKVAVGMSKGVESIANMLEDLELKPKYRQVYLSLQKTIAT